MGWEWFAGLFEGEGHIALTGKNSVTLRINMTDKDVLCKVQELVGGTITGPHSFEGNCKDQWYWALTRSEGVSIALKEIQPLLGKRRKARVFEATERLKNVRQNGFCKRGHPMSGDNLYVSPGGQRQCRTCSAYRDAQRRPRKT